MRRLPPPSDAGNAATGRRGFLRTAAGSLAMVSAWRAGSARAGGCAESALFADGYEPAVAPPPGACVLIPSETQGPYPLLSVLANPALLRADITEGRPGVPLQLALRVVGLGNGCAPIAGARVYVWMCDKDGQYSGYQQPGGIDTRGQTFCRGLLDTDCDGVARFTTIYPGWYAGRITHVHFQVYLDAAGTLTATSQLCFPQAVTQAVYASPLYVARGQNTSVTSFGQDNVFADGTALQMATIGGDPASGYSAELRVAVAG